VSGNPWHSARPMRIAITSIDESTKLMRFGKLATALEEGAWRGFMADAIKKSRDGLITYGEVRDLAFKHFPWESNGVRIARRAHTAGIFRWVKPSRTGVAWKPSKDYRAIPSTRVAKAARERGRASVVELCVCAHRPGDHAGNRGYCLDDDCECEVYVEAPREKGVNASVLRKRWLEREKGAATT
jgi:hypothetical protein